jgi:regulator of replication initiation timing
MDPYAQINQLWQENKRLTEENQTLKQSLEELIAVNTELT